MENPFKFGTIVEEEYYLSERLKAVFPLNYNGLSNSILDYTGCHPYYSQQLAANVWQVGVMQPNVHDPMGAAIDHIVKSHGLDYERFWMKFNSDQYEIEDPFFKQWMLDEMQ